MANYHLFYAISKRTPPSPRVWKAIQDVQADLNRRCSWVHERLSLATSRPAPRMPLLFPFFQLTPSPSMFAGAGEREGGAAVSPRIPEAFASGSTRVRDNLWNAHLVVAFLRRVSAEHPELLFELHDDGGFVQAGAVWIQNGKVKLQREWLNRERERVLERFGDPEAAAPFVWAEHEALEGRFFLEAPASDYAEVAEIQELDASWEQLRAMSTSDAADLVVERATSSAVPAHAA